MQSILEQKYYKLDDSFNQTFKFQQFINQKAFKLLRKASWLVWSTRIQLAPIMTEILIKENQNQRFASPGKQSRLFEMRAVDKESLDVSNNLTLMWLVAAEPHSDLSKEFKTLSVFKQFDLAKLIGKILKNTNFSFLRYFVQPKKQLRYFQQDEIDYVKKNVFRNSIICIGGHKNNDDQFFQVLACDYSQEVFAETNSFVEARKSEQSDSLFWYSLFYLKILRNLNKTLYFLIKSFRYITLGINLQGFHLHRILIQVLRQIMWTHKVKKD